MADRNVPEDGGPLSRRFSTAGRGGAAHFVAFRISGWTAEAENALLRPVAR
jgi:hypothetical protein